VIITVEGSNATLERTERALTRERQGNRTGKVPFPSLGGLREDGDHVKSPTSSRALKTDPLEKKKGLDPDHSGPS